jgi:pseudouridine-5'-phosphate glycosidase
MLVHKALGLDGGQLVANPVPLADQISADVIEPLIEEALIEAKKLMINAKAVTPFLLNRIFELTEGKSLTTNIALVKNNARLASEISKTFFYS